MSPAALADQPCSQDPVKPGIWHVYLQLQAGRSRLLFLPSPGGTWVPPATTRCGGGGVTWTGPGHEARRAVPAEGIQRSVWGSAGAPQTWRQGAGPAKAFGGGRGLESQRRVRVFEPTGGAAAGRTAGAHEGLGRFADPCGVLGGQHSFRTQPGAESGRMGRRHGTFWLLLSPLQGWHR